MWYQLETMLYRAQHYVTHLSRHEWMVVFAVVVVLGAFCMRGFGSRTDY